MNVTTWELLIERAERERPHTMATWNSHRALYRRWQSMSTREQASEIRDYLRSHKNPQRDWTFLVPSGESPESEELFLMDLGCLFDVLTAPEPRMTRPVGPLRRLRRAAV